MSTPAASTATLAEILSVRRTSTRSLSFVAAESAQRVVPYAALHDRALRLLAPLQRAGAEPASELVIMIDGNEAFIDTFWACVLGGVVAVPLAPGNADEHRAKLFRVLARLRRPHLAIDRKTWDRVVVFARNHGLADDIERLRPTTVFIDELTDLEARGVEASVKPSSLALVQYSSGSTSEPKGVMLTHQNLLSNIDAIIEGIGGMTGDSTLSWMPLTHDMGLIGFHLTPLVADVDQVLMPTAAFVRRPALWLAMASEKRSTLLCSPNFGYKHLLGNVDPAKIDGLDLSAVRVLFNGAEPIAPGLANEFLQACAAHGLRSDAMFPVYGLAEASLAVTFPPVGTGLATIAVDRRSLGVGEQVVALPAGAPDALELAMLGSPVKGCELQIADEGGYALPDAIVGRIRIRGVNVTSGYYGDEAATHAAVAADGWLDTGDLGFVSGGALTVTGRIKDIIFVGGQNFYPHDLEALLAHYAGIELGKAAVCAVRLPQASGDEVVAFVAAKGTLESFVPVARSVRRVINEHTGVALAMVVPVRQLPKTTSGKLQRYLLARQFQAGDFSETIDALRALDPVADQPAAEGDALERSLLEICQGFMRDRKLGPEDNIFELGTSSLTLAQIYERLEVLYPGKLEVTDFFDYPTVRSLAGYLSQRLQAG